MMDREFSPADWSLNTNIYEVNIRQYTEEGTFKAFESHLPRLRDMGVEVLWFMPITPISIEKRLGTLGSYYACSSYTRINPEFGTLDDFKHLVHEAQHLGFKVIIDWVANHTGWDHEWTKTNPGFYKRNTAGEFYDSHGWEDVIDLNYYDHALRREMLAAMRFWVEECHIDGFRCDMAHLVPYDFWRYARLELDQIKPLFWLAESDEPAYFEIFDVGYAWNWMHRTEKFFKGKIGMDELNAVFSLYESRYPAGGRHAYFTTNHDENSWNGTEYEKYGAAARALAIFSYTWNGIPLVYTGQEIPNHKRLKFFEKDHLDLNTGFTLHDFYKKLNQFRKNHPTFTDYPARAPELLTTNHHNKVVCYHKERQGSNLLVVLNLSPDTLSIELPADRFRGKYNSVLDDRGFDFSAVPIIDAAPWDAIVIANYQA